jgi:hypothetical protein
MKKYLIALLIFIPGKILCQEDWFSKKKNEIEKYQYDVHLKKTKKLEGYVFGSISYYANADSSVTKVSVWYLSDNLDEGHIDYFLVNGVLVYKREMLTIGEIISNDKKAFKLKETIILFKDDKTGLQKTRQIQKATNGTTDEERRTLNAMKWDVKVLTEDNFIEQSNELVKAMQRK